MKRKMLEVFLVLALLSISLTSCQNTANSKASNLTKSYSASSSFLVIDFCTYFGGSDYDILNHAVIDEDGNVFVVGESQSMDFPLKNAFDSILEGDEIVVAGFDSEGGLIFSTYFGGVGDETSTGMCLGEDGLIYIVGGTSSPDLQVNDTIQSELRGPTDGFILVIDKTGKKVFSTYLGGNSTDGIQDIEVGFSSTMNIVGGSNSDDLPVTYDARDSEFNKEDAFYARLTTDQIEYLSYLGGSGYDTGLEIAMSSSLIYIAGKTTSEDFPLVDPYSDSLLGDRAIFVSILHETGYIFWSTLFGGSSNDVLEGMEVDSEGNIYLAGTTNSLDFPLKDAFDNTLNVSDAFLTKIVPSNNSLSYSTYIGGSTVEETYNLAVDGRNRAILTGYTYPTSNYNFDFPSVNEYSEDRMNWHTPFLCRVESNGSKLDFSTKFGTASYDFGRGVATNEDGSKVVLVGISNSRNTSTSLLPTVNAFQPLPSTSLGENEGFIAVFSFSDSPQPTTGTSLTTSNTETIPDIPEGYDSILPLVVAVSIILIPLVFIIVKRR